MLEQFILFVDADFKDKEKMTNVILALETTNVIAMLNSCAH